MIVPVLHLEPQGQPCGHGDPLAQGTGAAIHAGTLVAVWMALEGAVEAAQIVRLLTGHIALVCQNRVVGRIGMALAKDEPIPSLIVRIIGEFHLPIVQGHQDIHGGEGTAGVAGTGPAHHPQAFLPDFPGLGGQFRCCHVPPPCQSALPRLPKSSIFSMQTRLVASSPGASMARGVKPLLS